MSQCKVCDCDLGEIPMCFGGSSPAAYLVLPEEIQGRVIENADHCVVDGEQHFVRGHVELAVIGRGDVFVWSVWVSLSEMSFEHMSANWETDGRENDEPYFGWLSTSLPCYPDTWNLKASVQSQVIGQVPLITLQPSDHPLSIEQQSGVTMQRVHEIVHQVMAH